MSEDPKTNDVDINTKIFPMENTNRKGNRVGKIIVSVNNSASTNIDQINHYLKELFAYIKWASTKKNPKDELTNDCVRCALKNGFRALYLGELPPQAQEYQPPRR